MSSQTSHPERAVLVVIEARRSIPATSEDSLVSITLVHLLAPRANLLPVAAAVDKEQVGQRRARGFGDAVFGAVPVVFALCPPRLPPDQVHPPPEAVAVPVVVASHPLRTQLAQRGAYPLDGVEDVVAPPFWVLARWFDRDVVLEVVVAVGIDPEVVAVGGYEEVESVCSVAAIVLRGPGLACERGFP